jgi:recombinational DNA repair protein RecT
MSGCLKGQPAAAASPMAPMGKMTQQQKMTSCNADAKTKALTGADRKTFMSSCLKGAPASP